MFVLQAVLYDFDVNVSFATLLLSVGLDSDRSPVPRVRIETNVTHRVRSFEG